MRKTLFMVLAVAVLLLAFTASVHAADWGFSTNDYQAAVNEGASSGGPGQKCFEIGLKVVGGNVEGQSLKTSGKTIVEVFRPGSQRYDQGIMNGMRKHIQNMGLMFSHMQLSEEKFKKVSQDFIHYLDNTKIDFYLVDAQRKYAGYVFSFMSMLTTEPSRESWMGHALANDGTFRLSTTLRGHLAVGAPFTVGLYPPGEKLYKNNPILTTAPFITNSPETRIQLTTGTATPPVTPPTPTPTPTNPPTPTPAPPTPTGKGSEWVFVGTIGNEKEWKAKLAEWNRNTERRYSSSVSPNAATHSLTVYKKGSIYNGEADVAVTWTDPPKIIKPGQEFSVQVSLNLLRCTGRCPTAHIFNNISVGADTVPCDENGNPAFGAGMTQGDSLQSRDKKSRLHSSESVIGVPRSLTVYGKLGDSQKKEKGERKAVRVITGHWVVVHYIYEWR